jgi:hypothetical protein
MGKYRFEIQNCINVEIEADTPEEARMFLVENTDDYADQMVDGSCYISDGVEIK